MQDRFDVAVVGAGAAGIAALDRIFFAGEAPHAHLYSTLHGAWESGLRAAEEAIAGLG